uniref:DUF4220 domain-containing protein n=1 Tax=Leersia perrieri TaxID=77586 RepID=A0A0D9W214_9ORYZ
MIPQLGGEVAMAGRPSIPTNSSALIAIIADEDTVTGFLLAGVGNVDLRKKTNYLIVDNKTTVKQIEDAFKEFTTREDIAIVLISQYVANMIRFLVDSYNRPVPAILEIPSKDHPYDPAHDSVLSRVNGLDGNGRTVGASVESMGNPYLGSCQLLYGERVWALKCADIENLGSSLDIPAGEYSKLDRRGNLGEEEEVLLGAHYMFSLCRSEFVDRKPTVAAYKAAAAIKQGRQFELKGAMYMYDLAEVELSLMYDFLYTKAPVIHTWHGCCIRLISPFGLLVTFLLFQLSGIKHSYSRVDVAITYFLLIGAIILEITSLFRALGSTWICASLHARGWDRLHALVLCLRRLVSAGSNRRWLHSIGQHNLLDFCSRDKKKLKDRITKAIGLGDWWKKLHYASTITVSLEFKELVIMQIVKMMRDSSRWNIRYVRSRAILTDCGIFEDIGWSVDGKDLDECILVWHIATDIYVACCKDNQEISKPETASLVKAINVLSNYMGYLLLVRPYLIPGGVRRSLYPDNCPYLEEFWSRISTGEDRSNHSREEENRNKHSREEGNMRSQSREEENKNSRCHSIGGEDQIRISSGEDKQHSTEEVEDSIRISTGEDDMRHSIREDEDLSRVSTGDVEDKIEISIEEEDGCNYSVLPQSDKLAKYLLERFSDGSFQIAYHKGPHLARKLIDNQWNLPNMLDVIFGVWVEFLCYTAHNCTEVSHCRELGRGGDFLTVVRLVIYHIELFGINR